MYVSDEPFECYFCTGLNGAINCSPDTYTFDGKTFTIIRVPDYCAGTCALSVINTVGMYTYAYIYVHRFAILRKVCM